MHPICNVDKKEIFSLILILFHGPPRGEYTSVHQYELLDHFKYYRHQRLAWLLAVIIIYQMCY